MWVWLSAVRRDPQLSAVPVACGYELFMRERQIILSRIWSGVGSGDITNIELYRDSMIVMPLRKTSLQ